MNEYKRAAFIHEARQWLGTPFHNGARNKGHGVDCAQLIIASALASGLIEDEPPNLIMGPGLLMPRKIRAILERYLYEVDSAQPGDIYWMHTRRRLPLHLAIATDVGMLHASYDAGKVVETSLPAVVSVAGIWRFKRG